MVRNIVFLFLELVRNGLLKFFLIRKWFRTEFRGFFSSKNGSEWNPEVFSSKNGSERNSEGFSLSRNGSEWNSKVFLFSETGKILTELPSALSCSIFRIIIFLSENGNPRIGTVHLWTPAYTPTDRLTSWGVLHHPCTVSVYKLLFIRQ